jgi:hypothetical protein
LYKNLLIKMTRKYAKRIVLTSAQIKEMYDLYIVSGRKKRSLIWLLIFLKFGTLIQRQVITTVELLVLQKPSVTCQLRLTAKK